MWEPDPVDEPGADLDPVDWDPRDPAFRNDPIPWYGALRRKAPVFGHEEIGVVLSRYADIDRVLRDRRFGVATPSPWREVLAAGAPPSMVLLSEHSLLFVDPPTHTRIRGLVAQAFTPRRIEELRPRVELMIGSILDGLDDRPDFDVLEVIAWPVPILAVTDLLDVPATDQQLLHEWTNAITAVDELPLEFDLLPEAGRAADEFLAYAGDLVDERRRNPGDDLISGLLVAEEDGVDPAQLGGTIQNDILKEYVARGTYIYPPRPSMRLVTDTFSYCAEHLPSWNTISISGYHIREAGSTAVQEIAFTIANGIAYVDAALAAGLDVDAFAPRLSFFWNAHNNLFEEVAKYRAARRMWAKIMTERFGAKDVKSTLLRFHTQTGGSTLTAQQPENNIVRVTLQALAAALGGTQSLHTNGFDEALGLPTQKAAKIALRTQQIVGYESGIADTVDPLAGSWFVESLTDEVEKGAWEYLERIDAMGGAVDAIEAQYMQQEIEQAAYAYAKAIDDDEKIVIGVNKFVDETNDPAEVFPIDEELQRTQVASVKRVKAERDQAGVDAALADVEAAARGTQNLLVPMKVALGRMATLGEVSDVLRGVFGEYRPGG